MSDPRVHAGFRRARAHINGAAGSLEALRATYALSHLPADVKLARIAALNAKIDYLRGLDLDSEAHPWLDDDLGGTEAAS